MSESLAQEFVGRYVIVRCSAAGVHAGVLDAIQGDEVRLRESRRLWRWWSARGHTLSAVANYGIKEGSVIPGALPEIVVKGVCEVIPCTKIAEKAIRGFEAHNDG